MLKQLWIALLILCCSLFTRAQENIALGKRVGASGTTERQPAAYLTDGDYSTFSMPATSTSNFHYILDLDTIIDLDEIILVNTTSPTRLSNYRVEIFEDNFGIIGDLVWSADIRADGTNSGSGGKDHITAGLDPQGVFKGRYVKITNYSNNQFAPAIAEIEVYEAILPIIHYFETDAGNITQSGDSNLPSVANISWDVEDHSSLAINQSIGELSGAIGSIEVSPSSLTTYMITASNEYGTVSKSITIAVDEEELDPVITEFMASNFATVVDETGEKEDWIELYNPNSFSFNIQGYYLTDQSDLLTKWPIPSRTIGPEGYLLIFASNNDLTEAKTALHTNFSLDQDGEYLALVARDGSSILQQFPDEFPDTKKYPDQKDDISYGLDAAGNIGYFDTPTPQSANIGSITEDFVKEVKFTPNRGVYTSSVLVDISCDTPGAIIRYTTDGSVPTILNGRIYVNPFNVTSTQVIRAIAFNDGDIASDMKTHTYVIVEDVISSDEMDEGITGNAAYKAQIEKGLVEIPSISLVTGGSINNTIEVQTSVEWLDPTKGEDLQVNAGIKNFGGSFTVFDKKNFRLYFRGVHGDKKIEHELFEGFEHTIEAVDEFNQLDLRAGGHDMSSRGFYMSNRFADDIMLETGTLNPHGRFVNVYLNGVYWGQYHLRERWNDSMFSEYFDTPKEDFEAINGNNNLGGWASDLEIPYARDGSAWENVKSLREDYVSIKEYLDVPNYINFMLSYMYGNCESEFKTVGSVYPGDKGFKFYLNDADGYTRAGNNRTAMSQPGNNSADGPGSIFSMLIKESHPDYMALLADQIHQLFFNDGVFTPENMTTLLEERCTEVENSIIAESARWGYLSPNEWISKKNSYINDVLSTRTATVINQFRSAGFYPDLDAPVYSQYGGEVEEAYQLSLSTNTSQIYYTIDGSDPRMSGGTVSDQAVLYLSEDLESIQVLGAESNVSAFVPINDELGTSWTTVDFVEPEAWMTNEGASGVGYDDETTYDPHIDLSVMDNMANINSSIYLRYTFEIDDLTDLESIMLNTKHDDGYVAYLNGNLIASFNAPSTLSWNSSATANNSDEAAVIFSQANLVNDNATSLLNLGTNVLAIQGLNLSTTSSDFLFEPELYITKSNSDFEPSSIVIDNPVIVTARSYENGAWSALSRATFSVSNSAESHLVINELMASNEQTVFDQDNENDDWIELYNNSTSAIDLEGYYLSDDPFNLTQWSIPSGTTIDAGAYLTIWADEDVDQTGLHTNFKLSADGETIYLTSPLETVLDEVSFTQQITDISYGRLVNGTGDFEIMSPTFGTENHGLLDEDEDGVTVDLDCDDHNSEMGARQDPGTACNDGDATTNNDIIQADGCTCIGQDINSTNLVINELLASNEQTNSDNNGEFEDWVELLNIGDVAIDLAGYYLTDDAEDLRKWSFPQGSVIGADEYLIIWADDDVDQEGLHTNFKLSSSGESVYLVSPNGSVLDGVIYLDQLTDISYGRIPNGTGSFQTLKPTPGSPNGEILSVIDLEKSKIEIYPNPTNSRFQLKITGEGYNSIDVLIYGLLGNIVFDDKISESMEFDVSDWSSGMYIIRANSSYFKLSVSPQEY